MQIMSPSPRLLFPPAHLKIAVKNHNRQLQVTVWLAYSECKLGHGHSPPRHRASLVSTAKPSSERKLSDTFVHTCMVPCTISLSGQFAVQDIIRSWTQKFRLILVQVILKSYIHSICSRQNIFMHLMTDLNMKIRSVTMVTSSPLVQVPSWLFWTKDQGAAEQRGQTFWQMYAHICDAMYYPPFKPIGMMWPT
jgi:hypothetical protein